MTCSTGKRRSWARATAPTLEECSWSPSTSLQITRSSHPRYLLALLHPWLKKTKSKILLNAMLSLNWTNLKTTNKTGGVQDEGVPPEHQQQRQHLPGHPQGSVEPGADHLQGAALHLLAADGPKPGRPAGAGDRAHVQDRPPQVWVHGKGMDAQVRHGLGLKLLAGSRGQEDR